MPVVALGVIRTPAADTATAVRTALQLLTIRGHALGLADRDALAVDPLGSIVPPASDTATAVGTTLLDGAVFRPALGFATTTVQTALFLCLVDAQTIPGDFAAVGIESADTCHDLGVIAARGVLGLAAVTLETGPTVLGTGGAGLDIQITLTVATGTWTTVLGAVLAVLSLPLLAEAVAAIIAADAVPTPIALASGRTLTAATAAPIVTTLLVLAIGETGAIRTALLLRLIHANLVPVVIAAERVHFTDTGGDIGVIASGSVISLAAIAAVAGAILWTGLAIFSLAGLAFAIAAVRFDIFVADSLLAGLARWALATTAAATVSAALFVATLRHADAVAQVVADMACGATSAATAAAVVAAHFAFALRLAEASAEVVADVCPGAFAALTATAVRPALLAHALGGAIQAAVPLFLARSFGGLRPAAIGGLLTADFEDAAMQLPPLLFGLRAGILPAGGVTRLVVGRTLPHTLDHIRA